MQATPPAWPPAGPARLRPRHRGVLFSFVLVVLLPLLCGVAYLFGVAQDQYASTVGFTVRREEGAAGPSQVLGGLAQFAGVSSSSEADILYQFIQSQEVVALIDERIGLGNLYSPHWPNDPLMALWPDPSIEELHRYWQRMVRISYDQSTQLLELRVLAFDPTDAQRIAQEIVLASQSRINDLNTRARADLMRYANEDLDTAIARLKAAREALSRFRTRTQIVDPAADIQGRMGVLNNLQQQLAQALIDNDLVLGTTQDGDPRRQQAARRIEVIRDRIAAERETFASTTGTQIEGENYPALIAEFESLNVDLQFAEETYRAALAGVDVARANASRQSLYLAAYITPTLPQTAEYPQRFILSGVLALFLVLVWSVAALIYYSARDRN
ncbi:MAG: sugar transporter [Gemmobacter sp.]|nr:sugar transporter [Gemmobacter sp.]